MDTFIVDKVPIFGELVKLGEGSGVWNYADRL
jgi:hypothetical protein